MEGEEEGVEVVYHFVVVEVYGGVGDGSADDVGGEVGGGDDAVAGGGIAGVVRGWGSCGGACEEGEEEDGGGELGES